MVTNNEGHWLLWLMWVHEGRLAWESSSSTYPDAHLLVQVLPRRLLCFLLRLLGVVGQSQGEVRLGTQALQTTEGRRRRLQRNRERKTVNLAFGSGEFNSLTTEWSLMEDNYLNWLCSRWLIWLWERTQCAGFCLCLTDTATDTYGRPREELNRERCSLDTTHPLVCTRGWFSSSQPHHKHLEIKSVWKCLAAWFHSSRRGLIALGCFTKPLYSKLQDKL